MGCWSSLWALCLFRFYFSFSLCWGLAFCACLFGVLRGFKGICLCFLLLLLEVFGDFRGDFFIVFSCFGFDFILFWAFCEILGEFVRWRFFFFLFFFILGGLGFFEIVGVLVGGGWSFWVLGG